MKTAMADQGSDAHHYQTISNHEHHQVLSSGEVACEVLSGERMPNFVPITSDVSQQNPDEFKSSHVNQDSLLPSVRLNESRDGQLIPPIQVQAAQPSDQEWLSSQIDSKDSTKAKRKPQGKLALK